MASTISLIIRDDGSSDLTDELFELKQQIIGEIKNQESAKVEDLEKY